MCVVIPSSWKEAQISSNGGIMWGNGCCVVVSGWLYVKFSGMLVSYHMGAGIRWQSMGWEIQACHQMETDGLYKLMAMGG